MGFAGGVKRPPALLMVDFYKWRRQVVNQLHGEICGNLREYRRFLGVHWWGARQRAVEGLPNL